MRQGRGGHLLAPTPVWTEEGKRTGSSLAVAARDRVNSRGEIATTSCPTFVPSCPMTWHKRALEQTREPGVRNKGQRRILQDRRDLTMKLLAPVANVEPTHQIQSQAGQELVRWERKERRWEEEE